MKRRRSSSTPAASRSAVPPDLMDVLTGYNRPQADIDRLTRDGIPYDAFLAFCTNEPAVAARLADALHRHRRALVVEARRLGLCPPWMRASERS